MERDLLEKPPVGEGVLGECNLLGDPGERDLRGGDEGERDLRRGDVGERYLRGDAEDRFLLCELSGASCRSLA